MIPFLSGSEGKFGHTYLPLRKLNPLETGGEDEGFPLGPGSEFAAQVAADNNFMQRVPLELFYAICWRVKKFRFVGTIAAAWDTLGYTGHGPGGLGVGDPGQSLSVDIECDVVLRRSGPYQHGDPFDPPSEPPVAAASERDILGPNQHFQDDEVPPPPDPLEGGLRPWRSLQNYGLTGVNQITGDYTDGAGTWPGSGARVEFRMQGSPISYDLPDGLYYEEEDGGRGVYTRFALNADIFVPSFIHGFSATAVAVWPVLHAGQAAAGSILLQVNGLDDYEIKMGRAQFTVFKSFNPGEAAFISRSFTVSGALAALEYWPYQTKAGLPVYDAATGVALRDPFS